MEGSSAESECLKNETKLQGKHYDMYYMPNPKLGLSTAFLLSQMVDTKMEDFWPFRHHCTTIPRNNSRHG